MKSNVNSYMRTFWLNFSFVFLTCILFLPLQSCQEKKTPEDILIGKWFMESVQHIGYENGVAIDNHTDNYNPIQWTILFKQDGTGKEYRDEGNNYLFSEYPFFWGVNEGILEIWDTKDNLGHGIYIAMPFTVSDNVLTFEYTSEAKLGWYEYYLDGGRYVYNYERYFVTSWFLRRQ
jgi:hypothetical protein